MKRVLLIGCAALALAACTQVKPGHVGIKINQFGSNAGVEPQPLGVGTYLTMFGTSIDEYPIFTTTYTYTKSNTEGTAEDESFNFQDKNGLNLSADIGASFSVDFVKAPTLYQKYRVDTNGLIAGPIRNEIRNALIDHGAMMGVEEIYGPRKQELLQQVQDETEKFFAPYGLRVEKLFWAGNVRVPDQVRQQIEQKIANEQSALAAQAQVATVQAQAQQRIAQANGEAQAIQVQAQAIRTNPEIIQLEAVKKWDGKLPEYMGSSAPLPFLTAK